MNGPHTEIVLLAACYMELCCVNPEASVLRRVWVIRRYVDYRHIAF